MASFEQVVEQMSAQEQAAPATRSDLLRFMRSVLAANKALKKRVETLERQVALGGKK